MEHNGKTFNDVLGRQIKAEYTAQGFNMKAFAKHVGMVYRTLNRYVDGERPIPVPALYDIAEGLHMSAKDLIGLAWDRFQRESERAVDAVYSASTQMYDKVSKLPMSEASDINIDEIEDIESLPHAAYLDTEEPEDHTH